MAKRRYYVIDITTLPFRSDRVVAGPFNTREEAEKQAKLIADWFTGNSMEHPFETKVVSRTALGLPKNQAQAYIDESMYDYYDKVKEIIYIREMGIRHNNETYDPKYLNLPFRLSNKQLLNYLGL